MCWLAIGFILIITVLILGRSYKEILIQDEIGEVFLEGKIVNKQYKESSYGAYWQVTLKNVRVLQKSKINMITEKERQEEGLKKKKEDACIEKLEGKYLCQISSVDRTEFKIGQSLLLEGKYAAWEEPGGPGQFDSGKYYCSMGILGQFKKCKVIKQGNTFSKIREKMWQLRREVCTFLILELGEKDGPMICAMLLGEKSGLIEEQKNLYQRNGISHILAISGLHLTLLGMGVFRVLKVILGSDRKASVAVIIIMSSYCIFTGNSISTIRATIMFVLSFIAKIVGRSYDSLSALGIAAILQLFMNPYVLNNSGFLLSFLAVIGVTFIAPGLQEMLGAKRKFTKSLCISLAASITTLPVLLWNYGTYPWYSVFLNLFILPLMSVILFFAVILVMLYFLMKSPMLGMVMEWIGIIGEGIIGKEIKIIEDVLKVVGWGTKLILEYFEVCCNVFEKVMYQDAYIGAPSVFQIILYICLIALAISKVLQYSSLGRKMILMSAISILTLNLNLGAEVTMLDVGQGDGVVIRNDNGNIYISDCGSSSVSQVGKYRLLPFLKHKGYGKIKGIFVSHLDEDHISGIVELLEIAKNEKIKIEYIFLSQSLLGTEKDEEKLAELQNLAQQNGTEVVYLTQSDIIVDGNMEFLCLYPEAGKGMRIAKKDKQSRNEDSEFARRGSENRNNQSLVLLLKYKDFDMLLTGDVEKEGELVITEYIDRMGTASAFERTVKDSLTEGIQAVSGGIDVLKVAHHGSSGSTCEEFLKKINPKLSLISCGKNNSYGHPHEETLRRLEAVESKVLSTIESGAITLKIGRKIKVYEFKR